MSDEVREESMRLPRWRTKKALAAYLVVLSLAVAYVHGIKRIDAHKLDRSISQSLPPGTDKDKVMEFLDSNHIKHSEYLTDYRRIDALIPKSRIGLVNREIYMVFSFDEHGKLVGYRLQEFFPL